MPASALSRLGSGQRERLQVLGYELLTLRSVGGDAAATLAGVAREERSFDADDVSGRASGARAIGAERPIDRFADRAHASSQRTSRAPAGRNGARPADAARARLIVLSSESNALRGPRAALLRNVLAALGVRESEVRGEPVAGMPTLAFGLQVEGGVCAPALAELQQAAAKRALWPALRELRRELRRGGTAR